MEQLSGFDAAFVHQDTARTPMHICAVLLYDTGDLGQCATTREQLEQLVSQRLAALPLFRRKLRRVLMNVDTPYWEDVPRPQWRLHISESSLAAGADWSALNRLLGVLHSRRMDLSRPLWEMHLIHNLQQLDGLPPHCQALVIKVHHSAVDGISLAAVINAFHQQNSSEPVDTARATPAVSQWDVWTRVGLRSMGRQIKLAETMGNLLPGLNRARRSRRQFADLPAISRKKSRFNARIGGRRSAGTLLMPLENVLLIKRSVRRVTLNDIAMTVVSGALRKYLMEHGSLPRDTLACGAPVNIRQAADTGAGGNKIATMSVGLATRESNPVERLRLVHRFAVAGKRQLTALGSGTIMDISDSVTPNILSEGLRTMAWASQLTDTPVPFHTMVSNVPGPSAPMFLGTAELVVPLGLGPVRDNMGLFHIVSSSATMISLSFSACRKLLPDGEFYQQCLADAFAELRQQATELA